MFTSQDYRLCVKLSLRIMEEQRDKIADDSIRHYSTIYNGLHEFESPNTRTLYFQSYEMEWLDSHWDSLTNILKQNTHRFSVDEKKMITIFFADYFSSLMTECSNSEKLAKLAAPELIKIQQATLEQMIEYSDNWEERSNQLKVNLKKHKEHFKKKVDSVHAQKKEDKQ